MTRAFSRAVGVACVATVALAASSAASAPVTAAPANKTAPSRPPAPVVRALSAKILPTTQRCGEAAKATVEITNGTGQTKSGIVYFSDGSPQLRSKTFTVGPVPGSKATIVVPGAPLACGGPLKQTVRVHETGATTPFLSQVLTPSSFVMEQGFPMPPPAATAHWLRRIAVTGTCAAATVTATVTAPTSAPGPSDARVTFTIGGQPVERAGTVGPSQNLQLTAPVPLDCATTGLPNVGFALATGAGATGTLAPSQITFEP